MTDQTTEEAPVVTDLVAPVADATPVPDRTPAPDGHLTPRRPPPARQGGQVPRPPPGGRAERDGLPPSWSKPASRLWSGANRLQRRPPGRPYRPVACRRRTPSSPTRPAQSTPRRWPQRRPGSSPSTRAGRPTSFPTLVRAPVVVPSGVSRLGQAPAGCGWLTGWRGNRSSRSTLLSRGAGTRGGYRTEHAGVALRGGVESHGLRHARRRVRVHHVFRSAKAVCRQTCCRPRR